MLVRVDFNTFRTKYLMTTNTVFMFEDENMWNLYTQDLFIIVKCSVEKSESAEQNIMWVERLLNSGHQNNIIRVLEADDGYGNKPKQVPQLEVTKYIEAEEAAKVQPKEDVDYVKRFKEEQ